MMIVPERVELIRLESGEYELTVKYPTLTMRQKLPNFDAALTRMQELHRLRDVDEYVDENWGALPCKVMRTE